MHILWPGTTAFISSLERHREVVASAVCITYVLFGCVDMKKFLRYKNNHYRARNGTDDFTKR